METYDVIVVQASIDEVHDVESRRAEVGRYMYGRYFFLGSEESTNEYPTREGRSYVNMLYLVESHYSHMVIPRLASGLIFAHTASAEERYKVGL